MAMSDGVAPPKGLVMYLHGAGARASGLLDSGLAREVSACGNAFGAPVGYHPDSRFVRNWSMRARESSFERDDAIFCAKFLPMCGASMASRIRLFC